MNNLDEIILFDGVCNFCQSSVKFILKHDATKRLKFASLQSEIGQNLLKHYHIPAATDSIVFIQNGKAGIQSDAVLRIAAYFSFPLKIITVFTIIPPFIRNFIYNLVAQNRYRWFGKQETCLVPNAEIQARFVG
jgi:predicted DCC family thiol-disulfide oxidoreductase YuxK